MSTKRTEPDPTPAAISQPTKKLKTNTLDSRPGDHLSDCTDPTCTGCAAGEIELTFLAEDGTTTTQPPAPTRLLHMALEEASLELPSQHGIGMAKRLFDLAIEGFESLKKEAETEPQAVETRYAHATCLVEFGRYLPVEESAKEGVQLFQAIINDIIKSNSQDTSKDTKGKVKSDADATMSEKKRDETAEIARVWTGLGKAKLVLAQLQRKAAQNNEPEDEDGGDEDGEDAEGGPMRLEITKEERDLCKEAVECVKKGLAVLNPRDSKADASPFVRESILVAKELHSYGTLLDQPHHRGS
ncbi:hypothetical protein BC937DRAFT_90212 [Endogone sp. FLAS-F59071]|nr:hypothetical protein BC937DRAFT_90212 [Endogone sp. FLAS-F59071]|eukprot:RUS17253.1 hypothetical protein BC937DRAFT_90212 [Endogone sp. FLAS-F59071]